jgi:hypothetical protein
MSDDGGTTNILRDILEGLGATMMAIAGYIGGLSINSARKLAAAIEKLDSLKDTMSVYRSDELMYRVDFIRRLERLERVEKEREDEP